MPRGPRPTSKTGIYHFITRGINKKKIYHRKEDYLYYLELVREYKDALSVEIYHYCVMPNHAHLLLKCPDISSLGRFGHFIQRRYAYYYCKTYHWYGLVFQSRYKGIPVESESYLLECARYIERNPLRAHLVQDLAAYPYHSYRHYALGEINDLTTRSLCYLGLSDNDEERRLIYAGYVASDRPYESLLDQLIL